MALNESPDSFHQRFVTQISHFDVDCNASSAYCRASPGHDGIMGLALLYCAVLCCTILYCTVLYCTVF